MSDNGAAFLFYGGDPITQDTYTPLGLNNEGQRCGFSVAIGKVGYRTSGIATGEPGYTDYDPNPDQFGAFSTWRFYTN